MSEFSIEELKQKLTCSVCHSTYKQPKLLPCSHTFCLTPCLYSLIDKQKRKIICPECNLINSIPFNGVQSYPNNITIAGFLDLYERAKMNEQNSHHSKERNGDSSDNCTQCHRRDNTLAECLDCGKIFCASCKPAHQARLKNDIQQILTNLRKAVPFFSEKVGNLKIFNFKCSCFGVNQFFKN